MIGTQAILEYIADYLKTVPAIASLELAGTDCERLILADMEAMPHGDVLVLLPDGPVVALAAQRLAKDEGICVDVVRLQIQAWVLVYYMGEYQSPDGSYAAGIASSAAGEQAARRHADTVAAALDSRGQDDFGFTDPLDGRLSLITGPAVTQPYVLGADETSRAPIYRAALRFIGSWLDAGT